MTPPAASVTISAAIMALALLGDSLLYVVLPLYAPDFGVSLVWVGVLLAANRAVRVLLYGAVAALGEQVGPRRLTLAAGVFATGSTLAYWLAGSGTALLAARIVWGLAFAALNLTTLVYAVSQTGRQGRSVGRSRAIIGIGPVLSLTVGAWIVTLIGARETFGVLAAVTALSVPLAFLLPAVPAGPARRRRSLVPRPKRIDMLALVIGLGADGIFVMTLGLLLRDVVSMDQAVIAGGLMIALRRFMEVMFAPLGGALGDRFGAARMVLLLGLAVAAGMAVIALGASIAGAALVVAAHGALVALQSVLVAQRHPEDMLGRLATFATWRDIGAAIGPLAAGFLAARVNLQLVYAPLALVTAAVVIWVCMDRRPHPAS